MFLQQIMMKSLISGVARKQEAPLGIRGCCGLIHDWLIFAKYPLAFYRLFYGQ